MASFWNDIFGQLSAPQYPDQSAGYGPATEREGLEADIVGTMWNDPIALAGYRGGVVNWDRNTVLPEHVGEYFFPTSPETPDTIRFNQGSLGALRMPGPPAETPISGPRVSLPAETMTRTARYLPAIGRPDFNEIGRHEFRHRGMHMLPAAARANRVPFRDTAPALRLAEATNVMQDRQLGFDRSYEGLINFSPQETAMYNELLARLRATADQVNAERVRRLHASPSGTTWSDLR